MPFASTHDTVPIARCYTDLHGQEQHASPETLATLQQWLSLPTTGYHAAYAITAEENTVLDDWQGNSDPIALYDEQQQCLQSALDWQDGKPVLPALPAGYYRLQQTNTRSFLIVAPRQTYQPPVDKPYTGLTVQLYSLRSAQQWGIGDFADLAALATQAQAWGLDFVGLNPLHALFTQQPSHASPYSPSSRMFLNPLYLSVPTIVEALDARAIRQQLAQSAWQTRIAALNASETVDYAAAWSAKQEVLCALFHHFEQNATTDQQSAFTDFITAQGKALWGFALFEALCVAQGNSDWQQWAQDFQHPDNPAVHAFATQATTEIRFYQWLQWQCTQQLAHACAQGLTLGLYGDLAVGAARGSAEVWWQQSAYCLPAAIGAPPDHLAPQGQNWQLPPLHPRALVAQGFAPFIELLRANMRHYGILRIDHVMSLSRLWWIVAGEDATQGAYVHYPQALLFAIVALESQRAQCVVIGEDLGIVPPDTHYLLQQYGIYGYNVLYFTRTEQGFTPPAQHPIHAITVTSTHDVAPLCGYWRGNDLSTLHTLNILDDNGYQSALTQRMADVQAWQQQLGLADNACDAERVAAVHTFGMASASALLALQLENLLHVQENCNLPGVAQAYPNWCLRYPCAVEQLSAQLQTTVRRLLSLRHSLPPLNADDHRHIKALWRAQDNDPFAYLGRHAQDAHRDVVRILAPDAQQVHLLTRDNQQLLSIAQRFSLDGDHIFIASLPKDAPDYCVAVYYAGQAPIVREDVYRFPSSLSTVDLWLLGEGQHQRPYEILGAHPMHLHGVAGVRFCVWAPNAQRVSVVGDFNLWDGRLHVMRHHRTAGLWELFIPELAQGSVYKLEIRDQHGQVYLKADPYAFAAELRPQTASVVQGLLPPYRAPAERAVRNALDAPISIYEVHLGSWRRHDDGSWLSYRELADTLIPYAKDMGFTHLELLPLSEFPFDGSWGYQPTALYAPTKRFGEPADLQYFVQQAHAAGLGVLLDWVVGHFPTDAHGLARFDGSALYEHQDPREGYHQDWNTLIYNFGRHEVRNYLAGNALYWLETFGFDGLRVDAVASMIYRDYSRKDGEWIANQYGGRENLEAIAFLRHTNHLLRQALPATITMAEESTSFPHVTAEQGLHFHYKWNMGWMNDTLRYLKEDPINRKYHHNLLTFGMMYQYSEHFVLPLSHDEVVHGKGSLLGKMPGDCWQQFANLRAYYGFMFGYPGKKLLFMGNEFAQGLEWNENQGLEWHLLAQETGWHKGVQDYVRALNQCYQRYPALYELDTQPAGFEWLVADDGLHSVFVFERRDRAGNRMIVISNFTPVVRHDYRFGVTQAGAYQQVLNSDQSAFHGSGVVLEDLYHSEAIADRGHEHSLSLTLPPLATVFLYHAATPPSATPARPTRKKR